MFCDKNICNMIVVDEKHLELGVKWFVMIEVFFLKILQTNLKLKKSI